RLVTIPAISGEREKKPFTFITLLLLRVSRQRSKHVAAVILARGGSKGIPLKNLAPVGGRSLLRISLEEALSVGFDSVWVSTEHPDIRSEAERLPGVNVHWRSSENAEDWSSSVDALREFVSCRPEVDAVALLQCTSPFQNRKYLGEALERIRRSDTICVFSVTKCKLD
ncbi:PREDICTED: N-acylneuraminate cytidylyltransferase-like, partial [Nicrophorus vespilloides]|uniref:N-acylneuraminate cytidylyltransferase-like n=1 Tax=Nicrophorus vespilloides TaxID=110193 RepID=A0ABM1MY23_NICVS